MISKFTFIFPFVTFTFAASAFDPCKIVTSLLLIFRFITTFC